MKERAAVLEMAALLFTTFLPPNCWIDNFNLLAKMNGTIAQLVSLVTYGNAYLKHKTTDLSLSNSTFAYCRQLSFTNNQSGDNNNPDLADIAQTPEGWFAWLSENDCKSFKIGYEHSEDQSSIKDHMGSAVVGGGGAWVIETAHGDDVFKYWFPDWQVNNENATNNNIWIINYQNRFTSSETFIPSVSVNEAKQKLKDIIIETLTFAEGHNETFAKSFENALNVIDNIEPNLAYYKDLIPADGLSTVAKQALHAASAAWVFGGMGSWNDSSYPTAELHTQHQRLSEILYDNIINAIMAAVNS